MPPGTRLISDTIRFSPGPVLLEDSKTLALSLMGEGTLLREIDAGPCGALCWGYRRMRPCRL